MGATFANRTAVEAELRNNWMDAATALEAVLTQDQADELEALLVPAVSDDEKLAVFERVQADLRRIGETELAEAAGRKQATVADRVGAVSELPAAPVEKGRG